MLRQVLNRFRCLWHRRRKDAELEEEIRFHLAAEAEERIDAGLAPEEARAAAQRDFGNVTLTRELTREAWGWAPAERLLKDVGSAFRMMRRNTGYTCAVVLTMALGIGLNAAMYDLLSRLFLQAPPHIEDPDGIHRIWMSERDDATDRGVFTGPSATRDRMDWAEFNSLRDDPDRFIAVAGYTAPQRMQNGRGQTAEDLQVSTVSGEFFALLGLRPALGRLLRPGDDDLAATPAAVISDAYWRQGFERSAEALGTSLTFNGVTYIIVGVLPPGFAGPDPKAAEIWLPLQIAATAIRGDLWRQSLTGFSLTALARLAPGVQPEAAAAAATAAVRAARTTSRLPEARDPEPTVMLGPILQSRGPIALPGQMRLPLVVGGAALVVLLIATANMSNLLLVRVAARRRELAVRNALGAGRSGVGRLLAVESVVLTTLSGVAALVVAALAGRSLRVTLLPDYRWADEPLDGTAIGFTATAVLIIGLGAALAPAVYAARSRGIEKLDSSRGARSLGMPVRTGLIVVQAALSLILLSGAAIFYRSFEAARQVDVGYAKENLVTVSLGGFRSAESPDETTIDALESRLRSLPDVLDVAQGTNSPMGFKAAMPSPRVEGLDRLPFDEGPYVSLTTPNFFRVAGLAILEGRSFTEWDRAGTQKVAVVDAMFAHGVWPGRSAVGQCLFFGEASTDCTTVVGVVESALDRGLSDADRAAIYYLPISQASSNPIQASFVNNMRTLVVRTRGDPGRVVQPTLLALADLFPDLPRHSVRSLPTVFAPRIRTWTIGTSLFGAAALLAVLLAAIGLYAVIAFGVRQRELEFGIRRALGARASRLLRMVLTRGFSLAAAGVVAGTLAALWAGRFIEPLLFDDRTPRDPLAFAVAALVLLTIAVAASLLPARRASRADPRQALEAE
ncbi:MAG: FtsX-like permease family protein [Holophagales bacterium]|nr:FtsX-like permease family protein [Holophagales bacterium]MYD23000.1 FtsX-like permease family protein [Holophagales bacterium]MYI32461.1 FtsX-like permease family protein [Holophagales bacterium]